MRLRATGVNGKLALGRPVGDIIINNYFVHTLIVVTAGSNIGRDQLACFAEHWPHCTASTRMNTITAKNNG